MYTVYTWIVYSFYRARIRWHQLFYTYTVKKNSVNKYEPIGESHIKKCFIIASVWIKWCLFIHYFHWTSFSDAIRKPKYLHVVLNMFRRTNVCVILQSSKKKFLITKTLKPEPNIYIHLPCVYNYRQYRISGPYLPCIWINRDRLGFYVLRLRL